MTELQVQKLLEENQNQRGMDNWAALTNTSLTSYGIGLTQLRKLAKKVGRNHDLALKLWATNCYDKKVIALLIDEPKKMSREQIEQQVDELQGGYLAHVFSTCGASLAKTNFTQELIEDWIYKGDDIRIRCGYGLLYEESKSKKKSAPDDDFFLKHIKHIEKNYKMASVNRLMAMGGALQGMGKRNLTLHHKALPLSRKIGPIKFDDKCDPYDVEKSLTSDYLLKKFGLTKDDVS